MWLEGRKLIELKFLFLKLPRVIFCLVLLFAFWFPCSCTVFLMFMFDYRQADITEEEEQTMMTDREEGFSY